jgi:hypothetical protein
MIFMLEPTENNLILVGYEINSLGMSIPTAMLFLTTICSKSICQKSANKINSSQNYMKRKIYLRPMNEDLNKTNGVRRVFFYETSILYSEQKYNLG